jgi:hypothetical protein
VTGRAEEPTDDAPCDPLVRVATGRLVGAGVWAELCEPLAWVTTGATEADGWPVL